MKALTLLLVLANVAQAGPVFDRFLAAEKSYVWHYGLPKDKWGLKQLGGYKWISPGSAVVGSVFEVRQTREYPLAPRIMVTQILGPASFFDRKHGLIIHGISTANLNEGKEYPLPTRGRLVGICGGLRIHNYCPRPTCRGLTYRVPEILLEMVPPQDVAKH
jgi:hypothetical protein